MNKIVNGVANDYEFPQLDKTPLYDIKPEETTILTRWEDPTIKNLQQELDQYKNNWEELKKWLDRKREGYQKAHIDIPYVLGKMKELEEDK